MFVVLIVQCRISIKCATVMWSQMARSSLICSQEQLFVCFPAIFVWMCVCVCLWTGCHLFPLPPLKNGEHPESRTVSSKCRPEACVCSQELCPPSWLKVLGVATAELVKSHKKPFLFSAEWHACNVIHHMVIFSPHLLHSRMRITFSYVALFLWLFITWFHCCYLL